MAIAGEGYCFFRFGHTLFKESVKAVVANRQKDKHGKKENGVKEHRGHSQSLYWYLVVEVEYGHMGKVDSKDGYRKCEKHNADERPDCLAAVGSKGNTGCHLT